MTTPTPDPASVPSQGTDRSFNNADSFAQAFDQAWHSRSGSGAEPGLEGRAKLDHILDHISDHPFAQADPALARQVGEFRIRLLGL
jgi:hypothetical protein